MATSEGSRPAFAAPWCTLSTEYASRPAAVQLSSTPSAISPASSSIAGPSAAMNTGGGWSGVLRPSPASCRLNTRPW